MTECVSTDIISIKHRHGMLALMFAAAVFVFAVGCAQKGSPVEVEGGTGGYRIVGTLAIAGYAEDLEVSGTLCILAAGQGGLVLVDVSDPVNPEYLSTGVTSYAASGCAYVASDSLAFAAIGAQGIYVYDVSDLSNPVWQSNGQGVFTRDVVTREVALGDYHEVLMADGYGIRAQECYYYEGLDTWYFRQGSDASSSGVSRGICLYEDMAFLAKEELGLSVYDVTDITNVTFLGCVDTPGEARAVTVSGSYAYVADWRKGLQVVDVANPGSPEIVASSDTDGLADGIWYHDDKVYVAAHTGGVRVFDVSDPTNPQEAGFLETPFANDVFVTDSHVYVADRDWGLVVAEEE